MRRSSGTTLIFVLGVLALLSLFAISFASITRVERKAAGNYVDEVRADLAARAGIAAGIAAAHEAFRHPDAPTNTEAGYLAIPPFPFPATPAINGGARWFYRGHSKNPTSTGNGIPLSVAMSTGAGTTGFGIPSMSSSTGPTLTNSVPPTLFEASGSIGGTYMADPAVANTVCGGDIYSYKILDYGSMLNANLPQQDLTTVLIPFGLEVVKEVTAAYNAVKPGVGAMIDQYMPVNDPTGTAYPNPFNGGTIGTFFAYRAALPGGVFRTKEQLRGAFIAMAGANPTMGEAWYTLFKDYMAPTPWRAGDTETSIGTGTPVKYLGGAPAPGPKPCDATDAAKAYIPTVGATLPQSAANPGRVAVCINTAPYPVLLAVLLTCQASTLPTIQPDGAQVNVVGLPVTTPVSPFAGSMGVPTAVSPTSADTIAKKIIAERTTTGPFKTWNDVYKAFDKCRPGVPDLELAAALVSVCPVSIPLSVNPDRVLFYWDAVDPALNNHFPVNCEKATSQTIAEFSFTSGIFEVEAVGRVYSNPTQPVVVAEACRRVAAEVGGVVWVRGQNDLSAGLDPTNAIPGPFLVGKTTGVEVAAGWVQPKAASTGFNTKNCVITGNVVCNDPSVPAAQPFNLCDGYLVTRADAKAQWSPLPTLLNTDAPSGDPDHGRVEMWVKQPFNMTDGTNEEYFYQLRQYPADWRHAEWGFIGAGADPANVTNIGVATRLERYGNQFYACRFFWGFQDGASPSEPAYQDAGGGSGVNETNTYLAAMHSYIISIPQTWKAGTWHHVFLSWVGTDMNLVIDGIAQPPATKSDRGGDVWQNTVPGWWPNGSMTGYWVTGDVLKNPVIQPFPNNDLPSEQAIIAIIAGQLQPEMNAALAQSAADAAAMAADVTAIAADNGAIATDNFDITTDNNTIATDQNQLSLITNATPNSVTLAATLNADITAKQADIAAKQTDITNKTNDINAKNADKAAKQADKIIQDAIAVADAQHIGPDFNAWKAGGAAGQFATDVKGLSFTADLGLYRMKLRSHTNPLNQNQVEFLGYHAPGPLGGDTPLVTVDLTITGDMQERYSNGTFDGIEYHQDLNGPGVMPRRYNVDPMRPWGLTGLTLNCQAGWVPVGNGFMAILNYSAWGVNPGAAKFGVGTYSPLNKAVVNFNTPNDSNEVPWVVAGVWFTYETPTVILESAEVDSP